MKKNFPCRLAHDRLHAIASPLPTPVAKHTEQASSDPPRHFPAHATNNKTTHRNAMRLGLLWVAVHGQIYTCHIVFQPAKARDPQRQRSAQAAAEESR